MIIAAGAVAFDILHLRVLFIVFDMIQVGVATLEYMQ